VLHRPGEGERHGAGGSSAVIIKASGHDTGGSSFLSETTIDPGFPGPPPHRHECLHEAAKAGPLTPEVMGGVVSRCDFHAV
jgi:hypothetical protein